MVNFCYFPVDVRCNFSFMGKGHGNANRESNQFMLREKFFMSELEVIATFDTEETARSGARLLSSWFSWIMEGSSEDTEEIDELFDDFGLSVDDFTDRDTDIDWGEHPEVHVEDNKIVVGLDSKSGIDPLKELFGAMGAYDVMVYGEDD
jgi:hypothetical protein